MVKLVHAAGDGIEPRFELRREEAARVAVEAAGARTADQCDLNHLAGGRNPVQIALGERLMAKSYPRSAGPCAARALLADQVAHAGAPVADDVRIVAERGDRMRPLRAPGNRA